MAGPSLDGRAAKSQEFEDPKNSMASASSQHKEPLETLTRRDPAEGLRPASPPKINPWARNMKPKETTLKAYAEDPPLPALIKEERKGYFSNTSTSESLRDTEGDSLGYGAEIIRPQGATSGSSLEDPRLPILIKEESKGDSSDTSSSESLRSRKCGSLSIGAETAKPGNDDQESTAEDQTPSSTTPPTSTASPTPYPTSTSTSLTLGTPSTSSEESRRALLAAVSRAEENLWTNPVGADVEVFAGNKRFLVHRNIITRDCGWFRDNLPPPNPDGSLVSTRPEGPAEPVGFCLRFMYTRRIEICDQVTPLGVGHLPRCVLAYLAAVSFRVPSMVLHVLRILEKTSAELPGIIMTEYSTDNGYGNRNMILDFIHQLYNVFVLIYNQRNRELMRPLRMMMAQIIGRILLWLVTWQEFRLMASMPLWKNWLQKLAQDQYEYRQTLAQRGAANSLVPDEAAIEVLLNNDELREMFGEIVI